MQKINRLIIAALFGSIIFVTKIFVPSPFDKLLIVVQAVLLGLAALFIKGAGATYAGGIGGVLTALARPALGPFTFFFALLYGVFVDVFFFLFRVNQGTGAVNRNRVIAAIATSTAIIGLTSYYTTAVMIELIPIDAMLAAFMLFMGTVSGAVAGYASAYLWNKYLRNVVL
ncbi:MAG: hypothetical protein ACE14S_02045 [Candidatus Bathyarchaeia archaeon]